MFKNAFTVVVLPIALLFASPKNSQMEYEEFFSMSMKDLLKIEVHSASKRPENQADIPASVIVITREIIENYGYTSLIEVLQNVNGLFIVDDLSHTGPLVGIRGYLTTTPTNFIVLINGINQVYDFNSAWELSRLPVPIEAIEKIEVIKGPMSVMYGSGAFLGAINIITNSTHANQKSLVASGVEVQSSSTPLRNNRKTVSGKAIAKSDNFTFVINAGMENSYGGDYPISSIKFDTASQLSPSQTTGGFLGYTQKYFDITAKLNQLTFLLSHSSINQNFYLSTLSHPDGKPSEHIYSSTRVSFDYSHPFNKAISTTIKGTYFNNRQSFTYNFNVPTPFQPQYIISDSYEGEIIVHITPFKNCNITNGLYLHSTTELTEIADAPILDPYFNTATDVYTQLPDDDYITNVAAYSQLSFSPIEHVTLVAGVRLDNPFDFHIEKGKYTNQTNHIEDTLKVTTPNMNLIKRFALLFSINSSNTLKLLYGESIKNPSLLYSLENLSHDEPLLKSEEITTYEILYNSILSDIATLSFSVYRNSLNNLITREFYNADDALSGKYGGYNTNGGEIHSYGIETTIRLNPIEQLSIEANGSYQQSDNKDDVLKDIETDYSPELLLYLKSAYIITPESFPGTIIPAITVRYVDSMYPYFKTKTNSRIGSPTKEYTTCDFNLRINNLVYNGLYLVLSIKNLLNTSVTYPTTTHNEWANLGYPGPERSFYTSVGYTF